MDLSRHVEGIRRDLAGAAALGSEDVAEAGRRLADTIEASLQLRLIDVLTDVALALNAQLDDAHVEVRMLGREPDLVVVAAQREVAEPSPGDDLSARITLRLPESLKTALESASDREGVSTNAWIVRSLWRALEVGLSASGRRPGNRLQGYAQS